MRWFYRRWVVRGALVLAMVANAYGAGRSYGQGRTGLAAVDLACVVALAWVLWFHVHRLRQADYLRAATQLVMESLDAPRPRGVKVLRADGSEQPVELVYRGRDDEGIYQWSVAGMVLGPGDRLYADVMPGRTGIEYTARPPDEGMPC